ncbi:hypothetical protein DFP72DRAFT_889146 [Ephemerocybe angulata]|uniref:Uncharacterized protein n=1 Tax=Ephemerocybe angulata TaxID=980116 RepID=A0A8H6I3S8_9AGAR|nr:hypothetical protein DFP72DRAFT_889146 [Tulosesus angulatus]
MASQTKSATKSTSSSKPRVSSLLAPKSKTDAGDLTPASRPVTISSPMTLQKKVASVHVPKALPVATSSAAKIKKADSSAASFVSDDSRWPKDVRASGTTGRSEPSVKGTDPRPNSVLSATTNLRSESVYSQMSAEFDQEKHHSLAPGSYTESSASSRPYSDSPTVTGSVYSNGSMTSTSTFQSGVTFYNGQHNLDVVSQQLPSAPLSVYSLDSLVDPFRGPGSAEAKLPKAQHPSGTSTQSMKTENVVAKGQLHPDIPQFAVPVAPRTVQLSPGVCFSYHESKGPCASKSTKHPATRAYLVLPPGLKVVPIAGNSGIGSNAGPNMWVIVDANHEEV